jgi:hypothetical protein
MNKLPKAMSKNVTVDMKVTTDDLVNIHIAKIESELLAKQKQYRAELKAAEAAEADKFKLVEAQAKLAAQGIINRIPAELCFNTTIHSCRVTDNCVLVEILLGTNGEEKTGDLGRFQLARYPGHFKSVEVTIDAQVLNNYILSSDKTKEVNSKLASVQHELRNLDKRTRHVRAEISKRKLAAAGDMSALIDLTDSTNPMLSLPKDL